MRRKTKRHIYPFNISLAADVARIRLAEQINSSAERHLKEIAVGFHFSGRKLGVWGIRSFKPEVIERHYADGNVKFIVIKPEHHHV